MMRKLIEGFVHRPGVNCGTSALRDIFEYHGYTFTEDMIFGLGSGLGFVYWPDRRAVPPIFVGGLGNRNMMGDACQALNVNAEKKTTSNSKRAWQAVKELIDNNTPVMLQVDMFYLDYFRDKTGHFGGHYIVLVGYDEDKAYIADMDEERIRAKREDNGLLVTSLTSLAEARGSTYKPFPPGNAWFTFTSPKKLTPLDQAVRMAIKKNVENYLNTHTKNFGIKGVRHFARQVIKWPDIISGKVYDPIAKSEVASLDLTLFLTYIFMEKDGSGGGMFRRIYSRFLKEAGEVLRDRTFKEAGELVMRSADIWAETAEIILAARGAKPDEAKKLLAKTQPKILECAKIEEEAFSILKACC